MTTTLSTNVIVCYFHRDSSGLVAAFRDKKQTSFLLHFLKPLSPIDIECKANWIEITCSRQIAQTEITELNEKLQQSINYRPQHQPLRNCEIMLKITFELCRLLEGVEYIRGQIRSHNGHLTPQQMNEYLLEIKQQIQGISPSKIRNNLWILHRPPKRVIETNKRRISVVSPNGPLFELPDNKDNDENHTNNANEMLQSNHNHNFGGLQPLTDIDVDDEDENEDEDKDNKSSSPMTENAMFEFMNQPMYKTVSLQECQTKDLTAHKLCKQQFYRIAESKLKYVPMPLDDKYPSQLYDDEIVFDTNNSMPFDYNTNRMYDDHPPIYPNDTVCNITQKDFIDRKFHLNNNVVKAWVNDRAALLDKMNAADNADEKEENDEDDDSMNNEVKYRKFAIIDVRCHDFVGGNIPYCCNVNFEIFESVLNELLIQFQYESDVVFHCMYSQHRGPRAAFWYYQRRRQWEAQYADKLTKQRVWVLDGGFKQWVTDNILDPDLVCNFDSQHWEEEYFPLTGREFFYRNDWKPDPE